MLMTDIDFYNELTSQVKQSGIPTKKGCELLLVQLEISRHEQRRIEFLQNPMIEDFIRILKQFQKQQERKDNYETAQKIRETIVKIIRKQEARWRNYMNTMEKYQKSKLNELVNDNYRNFNEEWHRFMEEYKSNTIVNMKEMKRKQEKELREVEERSKVGFKCSKELLELRTKQRNLAKIKQYEEAQHVKARADELELEERRELGKANERVVEKKVEQRKKAQYQQMMVFLRKIQRERNNHFLQRKWDQERLLNIQKNQQCDIEMKYSKEKHIILSRKKAFFFRPGVKSASTSCRPQNIGIKPEKLNQTSDQIYSDVSHLNL